MTLSDTRKNTASSPGHDHERNSNAPDWKPGLATPKHIAIIMDGNQRWANAKGLPGLEGHKEGAKAVKRTVKACVRQGVQALTLFAFSSENWRRPEEEVAGLMKLFFDALKTEVSELVQEGVKLTFFGDLSAFDEPLITEMSYAMEQTKSNQGFALNVAVNYGGRWDILNAAKEMMKEAAKNGQLIDDLTEPDFEAYLALNDLPNVDLCIRTSGEQRISNFLLWQIAYAELIFTPVYWPDFDEANLKSLINVYASRQRRFGRSSAQINRLEVTE